jgi:sucrose phosphorylase
MKKTNSYDARDHHFLSPDYNRNTFNIPEKHKESILDKLALLYGADYADEYYSELERIIKVYFAHKTPKMISWEENIKAAERFTEEDIILITYGDLIHNRSEKPLKTMKELCKKYLNGVFNTIHILPFFPYSSDRGFAVMDFEEVDPQLGKWEDILDLKSDFKLMFDGVFNHVSSKSRWFQEFLNQNPYYADFFTVFSTSTQISADHLGLIVRPRTSDLLTPFDTLEGKRLVWTTFSNDQIDLNFHNPRVLLKMVEILLTYVRRGADIIRLDAVTYLWEELGTSCVHLDQTHAVIKLFREILDVAAPHTALITETNVRHDDNVRYFGNGFDEAQMVYNFALPPLVLYTIQNENAGKLSEWAASLEKVSDQATFFNFLDSHDGVGLMAVNGILSAEEIEMMALKILEHGGYISYKANGDGSQSPYELNITWFSAVNNEDAGEPVELQIRRYLASRAIALVLMGVPGVYLHGLLGSKNDAELVIEQKQTRSINRKNLNKDELLKALENPNSSTFQVTVRLIRLIRRRIKERAFHPNSPQKILNISESLFSVLRSTPDGKEHILALINVTSKLQSIEIDLPEVCSLAVEWQDIISRAGWLCKNGEIKISLKPYQIVWLKARL